MAKLPDPNVTVDGIREMARRTKIRLTGKTLTPEQYDALFLAQLWDALDEHMTEQGDHPRDWKPF
jgi:hypothetical protein